MLTIRLQRAGKRNRPEFRIVVAQTTAAAGKKFVEILGNYNPRTKEFTIKDEPRLKYWIAQQVTLSPTVHNLFVTKSIISEKKTQAFKIPKKPVEAAAVENAPAAETPAVDSQSPTSDSVAPVVSEAE